jgi:TonB family protein
MSGKLFKKNRRLLTCGLAFPATFVSVGLLWAGAAAQTANPPTCAAMCDTGAEPIIYRVGGDVTQPTVLNKVEVELTEQARAASISGTVTVQIEIRSDGMAHNIRVTRGSALFLQQDNLGLATALDQSAIDAIRHWRFQPATRNGHPVTVEATIELTFRPLSAREAPSKHPEQIRVGQTRNEVSSVMGQPPQTKGHRPKENLVLRDRPR